MSWLMLAVVVISFVAKWQGFSFPTERSGPSPRIPLKPISSESRELLDALRAFCEEEGLAPRSLAEIEEYSHLTKLRDRYTLFTVPDYPALVINQNNGPERGSLHIWFHGDHFRVITRDWAVGGFSFRDRYFFDHQSINYQFHSFASRRSRKVELRLRRRAQTNDEQAWKELVTYMKVIDPVKGFRQSCKDMQKRLPRSRWAKLAIPCAELVSQNKRFRHLQFQSLVRIYPDYYPDYFRAVRRSLSKREFLDFARQTLPNVPAAHRSACYKEAVMGAYKAGDFKQALRFCRSWNTKESAILYAASFLACKSPKAAMLIYQRFRGVPIGRPDHNNLEFALLNGDESYRLPEEMLEAKPFFPNPRNYLGIPIRRR